ncbi:hypothetical protein Kpol_1031p48 [Vanderwaltozyma polyspora DSM 70294]|uniref:Uncharacterized protein n=1 Tax=Vanderwaltozyma polyspora (strain ATCC 22028 / DSM 70294 / BCRC 21397 / CBS 2163 / NBRC 10782 / NRRL Y-8283 / UCD 57-17) TaxID=436907 RepID=A7THY0_VANPO|nr:uncharacterized protein Kpol_1031p48 [Vanderwaltozyma polyspora DSM 70294]EDO18142.1 hypothetical protein Kpol_1031p48 [Vanderwaltozyma polyspora DSM 70294]
MFHLGGKGSKKNKIKFIPIEEVNSKDPESKSNYATIDDIRPLEWYVHPDSLQHLDNSTHSSIIGAIKPNMQSRVETQTLYFTDLKSGRSGFVQLVYSSVINGLYKGFQLNFKIFGSEKKSSKDIWETYKLDNLMSFRPLRVEFDDVLFEFVRSDKKNESGGDVIAQLNIKVDIRPKPSENQGRLKIDLKADLYQGYMINPNGCSYYLDKAVSSVSQVEKGGDQDISSKMLRHLFIPRGRCSGTISYTDSKGENDIKLTLSDVPISYIDAVQGLLPNKAAKSWNFLCYQSENYSILCMEYTTTEEYGNDTVTIYSITNKEKITKLISCVNKCKVVYDKTIEDKDNGWSYPTSIAFPMDFSEPELNLVNRYDIMEELPLIVKKIAQNIANVKPYIYQYCQKSSFENEEGISIIESTFIS